MGLHDGISSPDDDFLLRLLLCDGRLMTRTPQWADKQRHAF
jgi:hypothetical protein